MPTLKQRNSTELDPTPAGVRRVGPAPAECRWGGASVRGIGAA